MSGADAPRGSENGNRYSPTGREVLTGVTRQLIDVTAPRPEQVDIRDIALSLSQQMRFTGHCTLRPTIAQHSLAAERIHQRRLGIVGHAVHDHDVPLLVAGCRAVLMHDASEFIVSDLNGAVKKQLRAGPTVAERKYGPDVSEFDRLESLAERAIAVRYDCAIGDWGHAVHEADILACAYEMAWGGWCPDAHPPTWVGPVVYNCYNRTGGDGGYRAFLDRAAELGMA